MSHYFYGKTKLDKKGQCFPYEKNMGKYKMNHTPKISVIIPVYNVEKYLPRCLNSICQQTYTDFEVILIDDGSTDCSNIICNKYAYKDSRIQVIHTKNQGPSAARNIGIDICQGEFITFIDSDDAISPDMLEHMLDIQKKTNASIVSVRHIFVDCSFKGHSRNNEYAIKHMNRNEALEYYIYSSLAYKECETTPFAKLFHRDTIKNIHFPVNEYYEDIATIFKFFLKSNNYVKSNKICYYYFQNQGSTINSSFNNKNFDMIKAAYDLYELSKLESSLKLTDLAKQKITRCHFTLLGKIAQHGISPGLSEQEIVPNLLKVVRKNFSQQLFSPMPLSRKCILVIMCINWNLAKLLINIAYKNINTI